MQKYLYRVRINNKKLNIHEKFEFISHNGDITKTDFLDWDSFTIKKKPIVEKNHDDQILEKLKNTFGMKGR